MLTSLPMYDWPELRGATDALWAALGQRLCVAGGLSRREDYSRIWRAPDLVFSQTCGYPFTHEFAGKLAYVATPHYRGDGCEGANYSSFVFAREKAPPGAFRGATAAVNTPDSMSGMLALKLVFAPLADGGRFFGRSLFSGGHRKSLAAVREGRADVCAIDSVCVALARRHCPDELEGLHIIAQSPLVPGLPYVTAPDRDPAPLRDALQDVLNDAALAEVRAALHLSGLSVLPATAYDRIIALEDAMERAGGLQL